MSTLRQVVSTIWPSVAFIAVLLLSGDLLEAEGPLLMPVLSAFVAGVVATWWFLARPAVGSGVTPSRSEELRQRLSSSRPRETFTRPEDVTDLAWAEMLADRYGVPLVDLQACELELSVLDSVPWKTAVKYKLVPISRNGAKLSVAMADPSNVFAMDDLKFMTGFKIEPAVAPEAQILQVLGMYSDQILSDPWVLR